MTTTAPSRRRSRLPRPLLIAAGAVLIAIVAVAAFLLRPKAAVEPYRTQAVERGEIVRAVSASGALQALVTVQVGSQLSGQVTQVLVDFNTPVKKGQLLAIVDPSTFQSRADQSAADLNAQQAALLQQQAGLANAQADLELKRVTYERSKTLAEKGWLAQAALDTAQADLKKAQAAIGVSRAQISAQAARIGQSRASLAVTELDVSRTRILSPIDGVVVSRAVDPGQTVAAGLQVSTLFQIAQDLSKLQVKILVDEADIGQVREGQRVNFTVDAFPEEIFTGVVTQVRKQPETSVNVVAYSVIAEADNRGGRLLPGMTANANIIIAQHSDVLKVPSAALRWRPADQPLTAASRPGGAGGQNGQLAGRGGDRAAKGFTRGTVWMLEKNKPTPISVQVGGTDGSTTEIRGDIKEGQGIIIGGGPRPKATLPGARPGGGGLPGLGGGPGGGGVRRIG
ncbi:MAG: hypothetical protein B7Y99_09060 [Caulobacterales bacterium 32-69-10]|nr:MAG: hypothetical protein B7Y99_09060 [Caulobacterales bacterium 32-69-10]